MVLGAALLLATVALWLATREAPTPVTLLPQEEEAKRKQDPSARPAVTSPEAAAEERARATEPWREAPVRTGPDAANSYKNAFVLFDRLTEEEKEMIRRPKEEVDAEKAAQLFEKVRPILELLREAAQAGYCDWGQAPYTFDTPMPQIQKGNDLGKLGLWAAAYQFPTDPAAALAVLGDRAKLGHHLADTLIGVLVQTGFERSANELLLAQASGLEGARAGALELLRGSTLDGNVARAFEAEVQGIESVGKRLAGGDPEVVGQMAGMAEGQSPEQRESLAKMLLAVSSDPARLAAEIAFISEMDRQVAKALLLPEAEFQAWRREAEAQVREHPMAALVLPGFTMVQARLQQTRVERTMLSAGLAVLMGGPAQLAGFRDPATQRALTYVPTPAGFELRSGYAVKGKPVTMSFPSTRPAAP